MRFMVLVKADKNSEAGVLPDEKLLTEMGKYNEELAKAGVLLAADGLHPSSKGARVRFSGEKRTVLEQNAAEGRKSLEVLDAHLAATPFLVGGKFTAADIIVGFAVNWVHNLGGTADLANCLAYNARLLEMPNCPYGRN